MTTKSRTSTSTTPAAVFLAIVSLAVPLNAQFKTVGPAPYTRTVARQRIRALLAKIAPVNEAQTIRTVSGLLVWYRDIIDDELISAWKKDEGRENLPGAITELADAGVAVAIIDFSWREKRESTFRLEYAPMFGNLMLRFPESATPFLGDLLASTAAPGGQSPLDLTEQAQYAVCRILIDMPDVGTWNKSALQILPRYREPAETLLFADANEGGRDKRLRALTLIAALKAADAASQPQRQPLRSSISSPGSARQGDLVCTGDPIPKDAEYVFPNVATSNRRFEYDHKIWDVRLEPGQGDTRNFILRNKSSKTQKSCVVHWAVLP